MPPPHLYGLEEPSASNILSQSLSCIGNWLKRCSRSRRSLAATIILCVLALYILWPSKLSVDSSLRTEHVKMPSVYENVDPEKRADAVKEAFMRAYAAYERYALPADEYKPLSNTSQQK